MENVFNQKNSYTNKELGNIPIGIKRFLFSIIVILLLLGISIPALHAQCSSCGGSFTGGYSDALPAYRTPANQCANCATCTGIPDSYRNPPECIRDIPIPENGKRVYNCPQRKKHIVKIKRPPSIVVTDYYCFEKKPKFKKCCPFPPRIVACRTINPANIIDSTCKEFPQKIRTCQPYTCQAPSSQDPYVKTIWQIHQKVGNRCVVSNIIDSVGIKDENGEEIPITQICEYDKIGVIALMKRFADMEKEFYHFSTCENFRGVHNCTYHANGKVFRRIKDIRKPPY